MSSFSEGLGPEEEDGAGWGGLIPSREEREENEARTTLAAWHSVFGTTQLTHAKARLEKAESDLARATERRFPIMDRGPSIPWSMIAPHDASAKRNHDQTLERLAQRGGLSPYEAICVLDGRDPFKSRNAWVDPRAELERRRAEYEEHRACRAALVEVARRAIAAADWSHEYTGEEPVAERIVTEYLAEQATTPTQGGPPS